MDHPATDDSATLTTGAYVVADVPEDASLDQFASSGKPDESETDDSTDSDTSEAADPEESAVQSEEVEELSEESNDSSAVEPAVSTFTWSPEGGECADCGASVERRWRSEGERDGNLVCADCKEW